MAKRRSGGGNWTMIAGRRVECNVDPCYGGTVQGSSQSGVGGGSPVERSQAALEASRGSKKRGLLERMGQAAVNRSFKEEIENHQSVRDITHDLQDTATER